MYHDRSSEYDLEYLIANEPCLSIFLPEQYFRISVIIWIEEGLPDAQIAENLALLFVQFDSQVRVADIQIVWIVFYQSNRFNLFRTLQVETLFVGERCQETTSFLANRILGNGWVGVKGNSPIVFQSDHNHQMPSILETVMEIDTFHLREQI